MSIATAATKVESQLAEMLRKRRENMGVAETATIETPSGEPLFTAVAESAVTVPDGKNLLSNLLPAGIFDASKHKDLLVTVGDTSRYTESQAARIPDINPVYRPNMQTLFLLAYAIESGRGPSMLTGLPSVGKSSLVEFYCAITKRPFYRFNYNGTMDASSLLGTQSASGGSTHWHDGMITEAIQCPDAVLLHDEWTFAPAEVVAALQYLLEVNGKLILADKPGTVADKTIRPAENVRMVFADNTKGQGDVTGKFIGTQPQNTATLDRIGTFIEVKFMAEADEIAMVMHNFPSATKRMVQSIVKTANMCRQAYEQGNLGTIVSQRVVASWTQHAINLSDLHLGLELAFLNRLDSETEKQTVLGFLKLVA
jgi:cobaltochelatase CobS